MARKEVAIITDKYLRKKVWMLRKSADNHRNDIRPGRRRFGVYRYLRDIYETYVDLRSRRIARKAARRIAKRMHLSTRSNSHPIRILIEASAGGEDNKTKSRWVRALKYAYGWRQQPERLTWFFEKTGGISGAAGKYANLQRAKKLQRAKTLENSGHEPRAPDPLEPGRRAALASSDL